MGFQMAAERQQMELGSPCREAVNDVENLHESSPDLRGWQPRLPAAHATLGILPVSHFIRRYWVTLLLANSCSGGGSLVPNLPGHIPGNLVVFQHRVLDTRGYPDSISAVAGFSLDG